MPPFPGLRRFPQGLGFRQWTGNDSKALMKVSAPHFHEFSSIISSVLFIVQIYLAAISGYVEEDMVKCVAALLDFSYLARRNSHDLDSLDAMEEALQRFHQYRTVFEEAGVRPNGFSLPRQHALVHYRWGIMNFGSPNGLCSSITESRHITAVKRPWRASSRRNPILEILRRNTRLSKLGAARVEFARRGMLRGTILSHAYHAAGLDPTQDAEEQEDERFREEAEAAAHQGNVADSLVSLSGTPSRCFVFLLNYANTS